jgi:hypothetical protein
VAVGQTEALLLSWYDGTATWSAGQTLPTGTYRAVMSLTAHGVWSWQWTMSSTTGVVSELTPYRTAFKDVPRADPAVETRWSPEPLGGFSFVDSIPDGSKKSSQVITFSGAAWQAILWEMVVTTQLDGFSMVASGFSK